MISKYFKNNLLILGLAGLIILIYTYFLSTYKGSKKIEETVQISNQLNNLDLEDGITKFTDVQYTLKDNKNRTYITQGKEAFLNKKQPNLIILKSVKSITTLKDGSELIIKSLIIDSLKFS